MIFSKQEESIFFVLIGNDYKNRSKIIGGGTYMKKRLVSIALCGALAVTTLTAVTGCGSSGKDDTGSVYWLNFKPEADEALQDIAKTYTEETGVEVKIVTAASGTYEATLSAEMNKSEAPTIFVVGSQEKAKTWKDYCYNLKDTDIYKELSTDSFNLYNGEDVAAIGYCYESFGLIVNKTLLGEAGYSLDDIKNFDTLKKVADDIHDRADELGFDAFTSSGMDDSSSWRFSGHLMNLPLYYESVDDKWTGQPATITGDYMDLFKNIWDLYTTDTATDISSLASGGYDAQGEFLKSEAVFYQNGTWEYAALSEVFSDDELAMIPIYCGAEGEENAALCSGTENYWSVNAKASKADIEASIAFMKWLVTSDEGTKLMASEFGEIPYKSAADNDNVFFKDAAALLDAGKYNIDWIFNYTPNVNSWRASFVAALNQYNAGTVDWETVEKVAVDQWEAQYNEVNAE